MSKVVQIRVEDTLKKDADKVFKIIGLDMPTAVRLFLKKVVSTRSIPFSLATGLTENGFTPEFEQEVLDSMNDPENEDVGPFDTVEEMIKSLNDEK